jgi:hypothetical protein
VTTFHELPFGFTWVQDEPTVRASHALADDGRVWLVDPVDDAEALERARGLGEIAAVVQLLDRHNRDGAELAGRLGVPHLRVPDRVDGSPFEVVDVVSWPRWEEKALWWPARRTLVVPEAVGTGAFFRVGDEPVGVHALLRPVPPRALRGFAPVHLLVGHGPPVEGDAASDGLRRALESARRDIPRFLLGLPALVRASRPEG